MKARLHEIAHARSGDKGSSSNIGIIAREPAGYELILREVTAPKVQAYFKSMGVGTVVRYELPNLHAVNFVLPLILNGGGSLTLRVDAQGKALGQVLLEMEIDLSDEEFARARKK
jgi:hypothetical protein